jgi:Na+/proline symporter
MAIVLAVSAVAAVGGIGVLKTQLAAIDAAHKIAAGGSVLSFFPTTNEAWMPMLTFLTFIGVAWWASSYPGAEPGGGGYIAQRIFSAKSENDALFATLFFNVAHYALRPWPWILVALASLVLYPHGVIGANGKVDPELGYVQVMIDHLPAALRGLMLAGFLAAYMSTIGTHLNLGGSYLTNDLYRRFIAPGKSDRHYANASRIATLIVMGLAFFAAGLMTSVGDAWKYLFNLTAGVGLVMILRWYWWRVSAWSEIAALVASAVVSNAIIVFGIVPQSDPNATAKTLLLTVPITTLIWIAVTFATKPESNETLERFYARVRPDPAGWGKFATARLAGDDPPIGIRAIDWLCCCAMVYGTLFGIGKLVLAEWLPAAGYLAFAIACAAVIASHIRGGTKTAVGEPLPTR